MQHVGILLLLLLCWGFFGLGAPVSCAKTDTLLSHGPYCASEQLVASFSTLERVDQATLPSVWKFILPIAVAFVFAWSARVRGSLDPAIRFRRRFLHPILSHRRPFVNDIFLPAFVATHGF